MSKEVLEQVILKASSDARFRAQMNDNFEAALRPYDLSPAEKSKLLSGMAGLSDDREVRRMMAASTASSVAPSTQAATAAPASEASSAQSTSEASSALSTSEASSALSTSEASSALSTSEASSALSTSEASSAAD
jgi:hypothetical protein